MTTKKNETTRAVIVRDTAETRTALMSRFGDEFSAGLSLGQFLGLSNLYGLNPFLGHCVAIHGRFYIEREGWLHIINREAPGQLVGLIDARVGTTEEYEQLRVEPEDYLAFATITRRATPGDEPQTFRRHAIIPKRMTMPTENERKAIARGSKVRHIVEDPWDMAMKQATVRVLRMAFNDLLLRLDLGSVAAGPAAAEDVPPEQIEGGKAPAIEAPPDAEQTIEQASTRAEAPAEPPAKSAATSENGLDWSRLWAIANEAGMDRSAVHNFFKVPDRDGALRDAAYARAGNAKVAPVQIVADMADRLEADIRGRQPDPPPEEEEAS